MDSKLSELLPWHVNGTLGEQDRQAVDARLAEDGDARAEREFLASLRDAVRDEVPAVEADIGLHRAMAMIQRIRPAPAGRPSSRVHLLDWLRVGFSLPRFAYAAGIAVFALQAGVIAHLLGSREEAYSDTRSTRPIAAEAGPFIKASFRPDATEADLRFLLVSLGATIVSGPTQLGDYYLFVDPKRIDWAVQQMRQSPVVDSAAMVAALPAGRE